MFSSPIVQIIEVIDKLTQGLSEPYLCKSESNSEYIVKGLRSGRRSQIPEWVCANLAKILGLPIADFSLVEVPQLLYEELPISLSAIGSGIAFGSEKTHEASWFEGMQTHHIPKDL